MTISAIDGVARTATELTTTAGASSAAPRQELGKNDFLRLLVTQLSQQDPLNPTDSTQFVAQLAQFSSLEELVNIREGLEAVALSQASATNAEVVGLIGRDIRYAGDTISWDGEGDTARTIEVDLPVKAASVEVTLTDSSGAVVRTWTLGERSAGDHQVSFEGLADGGAPLEAGTYGVRVEATDSEGQPVAARLLVPGRVTGITFEGGLPVLLIDGDHRVTLGQVTTILEQ